MSSYKIYVKGRKEPEVVLKNSTVKKLAVALKKCRLSRKTVTSLVVQGCGHG